MSKATRLAAPAASTPPLPTRVPRAMWITLALLGLLSAALAGALAMRLLAPAAVPPAVRAEAQAPIPAAALLVASSGAEAAFEPLPTVSAGVVRATENVPAAGAPAPQLSAAPTRPAVAPRAQAQRPARGATPHRVVHAPARSRASGCSSCGIVESVAEVRTAGPASGLGAVAGGVLGGVLGSQVGGGNGKKAMAVLGAVGGGFAGHEVEKRLRGATVYDVSVRMDDGSRRTVRRAQAPAQGSRIVLGGGTA